ncbi:similar to Saccharomyces cerevisiae YDL110C TMA17 Protein of unknown function that associates with ribosomes [Maudiozyma saulgeensis]|uniref:Translation machinery-associated protein 17 n=1 Tax=Maudiozyma saulgeensis TaxID=1789683 RepID=A0A1X7R0K0_9SACH|nr:similar to Saccharomyces cerevisiae YDL110C TMA17 Protein of unknown function that associates with ribosomes [Kazachstania saulgeensis]
MSAEGIKRPIQIEEFKVAIRELGDGELQRVQDEINNNIRHLSRSNKSLLAYIAKIEGKTTKDEMEEFEELDNVDADDLELFKESLTENELILKNNEERIDALEQEHIFRTSRTDSNVCGMGPSMNEPAPTPKTNEPTSIYL